MVAGFKTPAERFIFWTMLNFAQQFFDSDTNPDFPMFDSIIDHKDLIFQDATVRLVPINDSIQTYTDYLGPAFIRAMERHSTVDCVTGGVARVRLGGACLLPLIAAVFVTLLLSKFSSF
jgi:melanoma-associated antigen p97